MLFENIDYIPLDTLFAALGINRATGYRYLKRISEKLENVDAWSYESRDGSLSKEDIQIFEIFTNLALEHNPKFAEKQLIKELEKHGYTIEKNQRNGTKRNGTNTNQSRGNNEQQNVQAKSRDYDSLFGL